MGKFLLIKGTDFSENSVEQVRFTKYFYQIPDTQMASASDYWLTSAFAYGNNNQDVLAGNTINGIRLNVFIAGTLTIYKATKPISGLTQPADLTEVATATTSKTGIQDIEFSSPVTLGANECLLFGKSTDTMIGNYHSSSSPNPSDFYVNVGKTSIRLASGDLSLDVDFFTYLDD